MEGWMILGGLALYALTRPRDASSQALVSLGSVTDMEYLTLTATSLLPAVVITTVQVKEDPVVGVYPKIWVYLKANAGSPLLGDFCRIIDNDTGMVVGRKRDYYFVANGDAWVVYFDRGAIDWTMTMPNRVWNLRIEAGTN